MRASSRHVPAASSGRELKTTGRTIRPHGRPILISAGNRLDGAAPESNRPSRGLHGPLGAGTTPGAGAMVFQTGTIAKTGPPGTSSVASA
jgi:hypothetical protein